LLGDSSSEEEAEDAAELAAESDQVRQLWLTCTIHLIQCHKSMAHSHKNHISYRFAA